MLLAQYGKEDLGVESNWLHINKLEGQSETANLATWRIQEKQYNDFFLFTR